MIKLTDFLRFSSKPVITGPSSSRRAMSMPRAQTPSTDAGLDVLKGEASNLVRGANRPGMRGLIFHQYQLSCLSLFSYLVGDESTGRAVVIDPQRDVSQY